MSNAPWDALGAVSGVILGVTTLVAGAWRRLRDAAERERRDRAELQGKAFSDGAASREDELSLMRSQRDDARRQRDDARLEAREARTDARAWEARYYQLLNRGRDE